MSGLFNAATDGLSRTTNIPNYNAAYTAMFRFTLETDLNAQSVLFALGIDSSNDYDLVGTTSDGTTLASQVNNNGTPQSQTGTNLTVGTEYSLAIVRSSATALNVFLNATSDMPTNTLDKTGRPASSRMELANLWTGNSFRADCSISAFKFWTTNLNVADIEHEMFHIKPQTNLGSVHAWTPMTDGDSADVIRDYGPNGYDWTEDGAVTDGPAHSAIWGGDRRIIIPAAAPPTGIPILRRRIEARKAA